jgi:hypothetical protein
MQYTDDDEKEPILIAKQVGYQNWDGVGWSWININYLPCLFVAGRDFISLKSYIM